MSPVNPDDVRRHFHGYPFGDPCTEADLAHAEAALGIPIPPVLRTLYRSFNGFRGPTDAEFLYPLFGDHSLVRWHQFLQGEFTQPWLSTCRRGRWGKSEIRSTKSETRTEI